MTAFVLIACIVKINALYVALNESVQCMRVMYICAECSLLMYCVWCVFTADESHPGADAGLLLEADVQHDAARHQPENTIPTDERVRATRPDGHQRHGRPGTAKTCIYIHAFKAVTLECNAVAGLLHDRCTCVMHVIRAWEYVHLNKFTSAVFKLCIN